MWKKGCFEAHTSGAALESLYLERYETIKKAKIFFMKQLKVTKELVPSLIGM
jgi:hypothetical protein